MASNYHTPFKEKQQTGGKSQSLRSAGSAPAMTEKAGPFAGLPGKAQPRNRSLGVKKIKTYNRSEGI